MVKYLKYYVIWSIWEFSSSSIFLKKEACLCITNQNYRNVVQEKKLKTFALHFGFLPYLIYTILKQH